MPSVAITYHNPLDLFPPYAGYTHAVQVPAGARTVYVSGLNGFETDGVTLPATFEEQAELAWRHLERVLANADMALTDVVSLRFYLADPSYDAANVQILNTHLGEHKAARTVVCAKLLQPGWLIEVEAIAAKLS